MVLKNLWFAQSATHCTIMTPHLRKEEASEFQRDARMWTFLITDIGLTEKHAMKFF